MRALLYTGEGRVELTQSLSVRDPGAGEVLVRVVASGLCHSDISVMNGTIKWPAPAVLGHEGAGIVEKVGPDVARFKAGDHVVLHTLANCGRCAACETGHPTHCRGTLGNLSTPFSLGGTPVSNFAATSAFAEVTLVKEQQLVAIDKDIPLDVACLIGCGVLTGVGAVLNRAKVEPGQSAAVFGIGGIGLNVIQGLAIAGATRIIAVDLLNEKKALAEAFGATDFVNPLDGDASEQIRALMNKPKAAFDSGGVDFTFECAGSLKALASAVAALDWGGTCVVVGTQPGSAKLELPVNALCFVDRTITGCRYGSSRPHHDIPRYVDLYKQGRLKLKELVTAQYPIEKYEDAFHDLEHGKLARGVLTF